jgi:radical SAM superfamily enzyme YgiQ (UPF0313 family)
VDLKLTVQVDTLCHKIPRFIEKAGRAGVEKVFIGLESINPDALQTSGKTQNKITEYRAMLQAWHAVNAVTLAGYILGFPNDTPESILRDIGIIQRELPIDILEFFILTPLPGSADHKKLHLAGVPMEKDLNRYDVVHVTTRHQIMSDAELLAIYRKAWDLYYSPEHVERVLRRTKAWGYDLANMRAKLFAFQAPPKIEGIHPLEGGIFRRKFRRDRRPGMPIESPFLFYPRYGWEIATKVVRFAAMYWEYWRIFKRVQRGPGPDMDIAMMPVREGDFDALEMFTATAAARTVVEKRRRNLEAAAAES